MESLELLLPCEALDTRGGEEGQHLPHRVHHIGAGLEVHLTGLLNGVIAAECEECGGPACDGPHQGPHEVSQGWLCFLAPRL